MPETRVRSPGSNISLQEKLDAFKADFKAGKPPYNAPSEIYVIMGAWTLPMPARYVIGQDGIVLYSEINPVYTQRPDPSDMLTVLEYAISKT
ncbi:thioredoxin domain-containing protein [Paraburkholderia oxyphila]|uniref:hypothetical protein n=1 Tax=Paraburkholderia oxyphila TaxID=614212 RepID=UPI000485EF12